MLNEVTIKAIGEFRCGQIFERKYKKFQTRCSSKSIISIIKKKKKIIKKETLVVKEAYNYKLLTP